MDRKKRKDKDDRDGPEAVKLDKFTSEIVENLSRKSGRSYKECMRILARKAKKQEKEQTDWKKFREDIQMLRSKWGKGEYDHDLDLILGLTVRIINLRYGAEKEDLLKELARLLEDYERGAGMMDDYLPYEETENKGGGSA